MSARGEKREREEERGRERESARRARHARHSAVMKARCRKGNRSESESKRKKKREREGGEGGARESKRCVYGRKARPSPGPEVLCGGEGEAGGDDALDGGVVSEVEEEAHVLHRPVLLEVLHAESESPPCSHSRCTKHAPNILYNTRCPHHYHCQILPRYCPFSFSPNALLEVLRALICIILCARYSLHT